MEVSSENFPSVIIRVFYYFTSFDLLSPFIFLLFHHTTHFSSYLRKERGGGVSFTYFDRNLEHNLSMNVLHISFTKRAIGTETKDLGKERGIRMYNNLIFLNFYFLKHRLLIQYTF